MSRRKGKDAVALYRMKKVVVEAVRWDGDNFVAPVPEWVAKCLKSGVLFRNVHEIQIRTPSGASTDAAFRSLYDPYYE